MVVSLSGYSGTPLIKKLGLKDGMSAVLIDVPQEVPAIGSFAGFAALRRALEPGPRDCDYVHLFSRDRKRIVDAASFLSMRLRPDGILWISWPKKSSRVPTDITEDILREIMLPSGLVDIKVCAIDDVWSGLKFMWRKELRSGLT